MRTTWIMSIVSLVAALALACGDNITPGIVDARPDAAACDLVSCAAGASFECCPLAPPPTIVRRTRVVNALGGIVRGGWIPDFTGVASTSRGCMRSVLAGRFALPLPLEEGDRMLSVAFAANNAVTSTFGFSVDALSAAPDGALSLGAIGTLTVPSAPPAWTEYALDLVDTTVTGGTVYWLEFDAPAGGVCVGAVRLTYERSE